VEKRAGFLLSTGMALKPNLSPHYLSNFTKNLQMYANVRFITGHPIHLYPRLMMEQNNGDIEEPTHSNSKLKKSEETNLYQAQNG
jgi:hypothetical protein